ncbi:hypothetical protein KFU94_00100 [Chloroflexi bacterium TSY]|nr:hypothetical protein [Chloroflexi bacterium TSY]
MEVKYRIVEEITPEGEWEVVGVIALWLGDPPHLQLRGMLQHTVSRAIWNKIRQRVKENELTLETYHEALTGYEHNYRIQTDIHTLNAPTPADARRQIREKYIFVQSEPSESVAV